MVVHEAPKTAGFGAEISATIQEHCFLHLEAPVQRVAGFDTVMPYYKLELEYLPDAPRIAEAGSPGRSLTSKKISTVTSSATGSVCPVRLRA